MGHSELQWHPAFYAALQIELEDETVPLRFASEFHLTKKTLQIDVLVVRKESKSGSDYFGVQQVSKETGEAFEKILSLKCGKSVSGCLLCLRNMVSCADMDDWGTFSRGDIMAEQSAPGTVSGRRIA